MSAGSGLVAAMPHCAAASSARLRAHGEGCSKQRARARLLAEAARETGWERRDGGVEWECAVWAVLVSDGSKCDLGRIQFLFGSKAKIAVQDPAYPVYVDSSVIAGRTGMCNETTKQYDGITYMPCTPENNFFPDISVAKDCDVIMFCNPNNPTGACATRAQLTELVNFARTNGQIIVFDSAYSAFITDPDCPKSIYEIPGAKECCIESTSFSKLAGFTGIRLGWMTCPADCKWACGTPVKQDLGRIMSTIFNGASSPAQAGGLAVLANMGVVTDIVKYYMENAKLVREALDECGIKYYGGVNAPYTFVHFPGRDSWDVFDEILTKCQVVTTPGVGFGPSGQGFVRISAFGQRDNVVEACRRLKAHFKK
jgi:LL-diaminopimelate aminotransferase